MCPRCEPRPFDLSRYGVNPDRRSGRLPTVLSTFSHNLLEDCNRFGLHRYEPVRAILFTRQGISLEVLFRFLETDNFFLNNYPCISLCRWDYIFILDFQDSWRIVSEDFNVV